MAKEMTGKGERSLGPSVITPSDSKGELNKNAGGMPETMDVKQIFEANEPPTYPAKNSVETRGSVGKN